MSEMRIYGIPSMELLVFRIRFPGIMFEMSHNNIL